MQNGKDVVVRKNLCEECYSGKHKCFVCKEYTNEVTKCSEKKCGKFYHLKCLQEHNYPHKIVNEEQNKFKCPLHICLTCYNEHLEDCVVRTVKKKLKTCIKCPTAYHFLDSCIAAGSILVDTEHIICPEHSEPVSRRSKKNSKKSRQKHVNVSWCFSCNLGGELVCCEKCPAAKHLECIIEDEGKAPGEGGYFCSDCRSRKQLHYNDIIWVKLSAYRWWPAQIKLPVNVPDNILNRDHADADFPVYFFGSKDYNWVNRSRSFLYMEGDENKSISGKGLDKVFKLAMAEVVVAYKEWQEKKNSILQSKTVNPAPYFHLKVNKPFGKCQQPFVDMDKSNKQVCDCTESDPCSSDVNCLNRLLMYECDGAICKNQDECKNQRFKKREYAKTEKFKTQAGWGLRCLEDIKKGQFVIEYVGELIDEDECNKRLKEMAERNDKNFYFLTIDKYTIIDAGPKGNLARFMNHSCDPNCETQKWVVNNQVRVGLFAKFDISKGSELTFNYNLECRGDEKTKCLCNSKNCSGFIGVRPNKIVEEKHKETRKRKSKPAFAATHEDECFRCGEVGKLIMCDKRYCPKSYHLDCLDLEKIPHGKWVCPLHHCDVCGKKAMKFCNHCPTSFCVDHQNTEMKTLPNGELICGDHSTAYLNQMRRKALKSNTPSKDHDTPTSVTTTLTPGSSKSTLDNSNVDQNTGNSIKKARLLNAALKEEIEGQRKNAEERKRKLIESRESRMKRRSSLHNSQIEALVQKVDLKSNKQNKVTEAETDRNAVDGHEDDNLELNLSNDKPAEGTDVDFNSTSLDSNLDTFSDELRPQMNGQKCLNESTKDKIVEQEEDQFNNNGSTSSTSSPVKSKSISQKENFVLEIEQMPTVGKILSDEILFNDESNESYLSQQTGTNVSQTLTDAPNQNGKRLTNGSSNDENKNHNLKIASPSSNEISETTS